MTMNIREVTTTPSALSTLFTAIGTGAKRPGVVTSLPPVTLVRP